MKRIMPKKTIRMSLDQNGKYSPVKQYYAGGDYYSQMGNLVGNNVNSMSTGLNGSQNPWASGLGNGLKLAGTGAGIGTAIMPGVGTAIGAGVGFLAGELGGYFGAKKRNGQIATQEAQQNSQLEDYKKQIEDQQKETERQQRLSYSQSYNQANPTMGVQGQGIYSYGGNMRPIKRPYGGEVDPLNPAETGDIYVNRQMTTGLPIFDIHTGLPVIQPGRATLPAYLQGADVTDAQRQAYWNGLVQKPAMPSSTTTTTETTATQTPIPQNGYGGKLVKHELGGDMISLASNVQKAVGDTHNQDTNKDGLTGITLRAGNKPIAEVEDQEVINNNRVFSDRLPSSNGNTFASEAEKLGKKLGKYEDNLSSHDIHKKGTAMRSTQILNKKLNNLFSIQEMFKSANGIDQGQQTPVPQNKMGGYVKCGYGGDPLNLVSNPNDEFNNWANGLPANNQGYNPNNGLQYMNNQDTTYLPNLSNNSLQVPNDTKNNSNGTNWNTIGKGLYDTLTTTSPYIGNAANLSLIKKTPQVPIPLPMKAMNLMASPLKTDYNINPQLQDMNSQYNQFNKGIDDNTSSSATARANKLAGFSTVLSEKNKLYGEKQNAETTLKNQDNLNRQQVADRNLVNTQTVNNTNTTALNNYYNAKTLRNDDVRTQLSANISADVGTMIKQAQDKNMFNTDQGRILLDSLRYGDAAGLAKMIGTSEMSSLLSSDPNNYYVIEKQLKNAGQASALNDFYTNYKAPK